MKKVASLMKLTLQSDLLRELRDWMASADIRRHSKVQSLRDRSRKSRRLTMHHLKQGFPYRNSPLRYTTITRLGHLIVYQSLGRTLKQLPRHTSCILQEDIIGLQDCLNGSNTKSSR